MSCPPPSYAWFITPHGFGHAARAAAVMQAVQARQPDAVFQLFTTVTPTFFTDSGIDRLVHYRVAPDLGLVQRSAMEEDVPATLARLDKLLPFADATVDALARQLEDAGAQAVVCDIAPLGILAAERAGIPSLLVENFTWDWIYRGYLDEAPGLSRHADYLATCFERATLHVQTEPVCLSREGCVRTPPVARALRAPPAQTRERLGVEPDARCVVISVGGTRGALPFSDQLRAHPECVFLVPGDGYEVRRTGNVIEIPLASGLYHPDLVRAADLVVAKLGYSTLAEVYNAGCPHAFATRPRFRESRPLAAFAQRELPGLELTPDAFASGEWLRHLEPLLALPRNPPGRATGARDAADHVIRLASAEPARV